MKTLDQLKQEHAELIAKRGQFKGKEYAKAQKQAARLWEAIVLLDCGVTEETLRNQLKRIEDYLSTCDKRFHEQQECKRKDWEDIFCYRLHKRRMKGILWILGG